MNPEAVKQAKASLKRCADACQKLNQATTFEETEAAWTDFLVWSARIYNKLGKGSRGNNASENWYGLIKKERKDDPVLRYIHHARNTDEHGIERILSNDELREVYIYRENGEIIQEFSTIGGAKIDDLKMIIDGVPVPVPLERVEKVAKLVTVTDDVFGDSFDPPHEHFGRTIFPEPKYVALAALDYMKYMVISADYLSNP
ncbi:MULTISPECIES: hypothetical protein [Sphingomonas]|uniref:hypothetical protein n=1 Tax=Sphingomonas TaxID=13687 RepID=UPI001454D7CE|nr:hypothetical protein [Sphingomonas sp. CCH10-B3]